VPMMTGGEAIVASLRKHGIDTVFALPGAQIYGLFDALHKAQPCIRTVGARHEQGCAYMALGWARSTGKPSVYATVPGPGILNASAALLTAYSCGAPVLCFAGEVPSSFLGKGRGQLHEMPDQLATLRTLSKWAEHISTPEAGPAVISRAFQEMLSGRRRPAAVQMCWDHFIASADVDVCDPLQPFPVPEPDPDEIDTAARILRNAKAPMILLGGGAQDAGAEILELAELLEAPVVPFRSGRGIVSNRHPLGLTHASGYPLWHSTDVTIAIGTRMEMAHWRWPYVPADMQYIRIDIDPAEMRRFESDSSILADAAAGTRALIEAARRNGVKPSGRMDQIRAAKAAIETEIRTTMPQAAYLDLLRELLPDDAIVTDEVSQMGFTSWSAFPVYQPRTFITSGYAGTLGAGFPMALGAKLANPGKPVVAFTGDGGFLFCAQELATAMEHRIGVVILLFNNNAYGNVLRDQQTRFGGRVLGSELVNPDFVKFSESFGVGAIRVRTPEEFRPALAEALKDGGPRLIEVAVQRGSEGNPWRYIMPKRP
jgi:acetolactate synthase I/II/III large subunit